MPGLGLFDVFDATDLTDFGNLAVVGPAAVVAFVWLFWRRGGDVAGRFLWPLFCAFSITVALKGVSRETGGLFHGTALALSDGAPSGHVAMSMTVYGGVALMVLRGGRGLIRPVTAVASLGILIAIAVTRVILHAHTWGDVMAGCVIGGVCAVWAGCGAAASTEPWPRAPELVAWLAVAALIMHATGLRFDSATII